MAADELTIWLEDVITQKSAAYGVDPNLVRSVIQQESAWDINAKRFEPSLGESSIGIMQVLLSTGRSILNRPTLTESELFDPNTNLEAGIKYLAYLQTQYGLLGQDAVIASYNAGSPKDPMRQPWVSGPFLNQSYVNSVNTFLNLYSSEFLGQYAGNIAPVYQLMIGGSEVGADYMILGAILIPALILAVDVFAMFTRRK
jgi:soluble lytic murein transglycosylase-like protein